jgi:hypothetical protein
MGPRREEPTDPRARRNDPDALAAAAARNRAEPGRRRRRRWAIATALAVVAILVTAGVYVLTLPPALPFDELWSRSLDGNSFGQGVGFGTLFATYSYVVHPVTTAPGPSTANLNFQVEGINLSSGSVEWSGSFLLAGVTDSPPDFAAQMVASGADAVLAVSWGAPTGAYLTAVSFDSTTGSPLADWTVGIPNWASTVAAEDIATSGGNLVTWLPRSLTSPTPLVLSGFNASTGERDWNDSLPIPLTLDGWGTGLSTVVGGGPTLEVVVAPAGSPAWLLEFDGSNGTILDQRTYNASADVSQAVTAGGDFYFLENGPTGLFVDGFDLSTGANVTPTPVENVADNSSGSAALYAVDGVLLVASYSPDLSYAAYPPGGGMLWRSEFPNATSCGQPDFPAVGPCSTDLSTPMPMGSGLALLSSYASLASVGHTYVDTYRAIDVQTGGVEWSHRYALTFGYQFWPWQSPEPLISIQTTVGDYIVFAVVAPNAVSLAAGTT